MGKIGTTLAAASSAAPVGEVDLGADSVVDLEVEVEVSGEVDMVVVDMEEVVEVTAVVVGAEGMVAEEVEADEVCLSERAW